MEPESPPRWRRGISPHIHLVGTLERDTSIPPLLGGEIFHIHWNPPGFSFFDFWDKNTNKLDTCEHFVMIGAQVAYRLVPPRGTW
jgi:hypothetical protein